MILDGAFVPLVPGQAFCLRPGSRHRATHDPARPLGVCFVHFEFLDRHGRVARPRRHEFPPSHRLVREPDHFERVLRRVARLVASGGEARHREAGALVLSVLHAMESEQADASRDSTAMLAAREAAAWIDERPARRWSVRELAERAGYGVDHFARVFKSVLGVTPGEYCIRARIERARSLLESSEMTVSQIADALGYADVFFFSRQFRQRTGMPPGAWRRQQSGPRAGSRQLTTPPSHAARR